MATMLAMQSVNRCGRAAPLLSADKQAAFPFVLQEASVKKRAVMVLDACESEDRHFAHDRPSGGERLRRHFSTTDSLVEGIRRLREAGCGAGVQTLRTNIAAATPVVFAEDLTKIADDALSVFEAGAARSGDYGMRGDLTGRAGPEPETFERLGAGRRLNFEGSLRLKAGLH